MVDEPRIRETYADLLADSDDAGLVEVVARLDRNLTAAYRMTKASPELMVRIERSAAVAPVRVRTSWGGGGWLRGLPHRTQAVAALLVMVLLLSGAAYATFPAWQRVFEMNPGMERIGRERLGQEVAVSQTVDGFTMTVRRVYADPNRIVIAYSLTGPPGRTLNTIHAWGDYDRSQSPILIGDDGREFAGGGAPVGTGNEAGEFGRLLVFDTADIVGSPRQIRVHLKVGALSAYEPTSADQGRWLVIRAPLTFDLTIPFEPGRAIAPAQVADVDGQTAVLERVVTAGSGTRVSLRGTGPDADVRLTVEGATYRLTPRPGQAMLSTWSADSEWDYVTGASLLNAAGTWQLAVAPGATSVTGAGPWEFRFTMP